MFRYLSLKWLLVLICCASSGARAAAQEEHAGRISFVAGSVTIVPAQGAERPARLNDPVRAGETIVAGKDGELHVLMLDEAVLAIRPGTQLQISEYIADGSDKDRAYFRLLKGTFRSISGWIAKFQPQNYTVRTKTATIGVRGTDHEPAYVEGGSGAEEGTYDKVNIGATFIENQDGRVNVDANGIGFSGGRGKPRLLAHVPEIFKRTESDGALDGLHDQIQSRLEQRRAARLKRLQARAEAVEKRMEERSERMAQEVRERAEEARDERAQRTEGSGAEQKRLIERKKEMIRRARNRQQ
jgi:hypothetical protein